jgi:hypothetical protein
MAGNAGTAGSLSGAGAGGMAGSAGANSCTPLPTNLLLTDFSPATLRGVSDGATWSTGKGDLWGSTSSLKGGDVFYQGKSGSAAQVTLSGQTLTVKAKIEAGDYMGYMFSFAPACTNASATQGLQFDVVADSTLGNATLKVQMQQKSDYPSTANPNSRPGDCMPSSVATQYNDCLSPATTVAESGSALTTGTTQLPWTAFSGGRPVDAVNSGQLMAIQWQFECPPDGGTIAASGDNGGAAGLAGGAGTGGSSGSAGASGASSGGVSSGGASGSSGAPAGGSSGDSGSGGTSGSGGMSGSDGLAGSSGTAGSGGESGSSGSAGSSGTAGSTAGSSGTAGSGGTAGSTAGSSGTAGSGGTGTTTPPCVVSFTFDNVTFY